MIDFFKIPLSDESALLLSTSSQPAGLQISGSAKMQAAKKVEESSNFPLTSKRDRLKCSSRKTSGLPETAKFFQLLGLQIELNLVPTMKRAPQGANFIVGAEIEFFVAPKLG